ncbi:MAG: iron-sulfur cluster assembly accessory protein [Ketobacteraceae bacterium]|nr:iron-sulfur cluster assembly accessory protein [Ketobacteraceae bacterium]
MSVETFVPGQKDSTHIRVTDNAIKHFRSKLEEKPEARGVRISVKPSGCSGYMYVLDYVNTPEDNDTLLDISDKVTLFIDTDSLPVINGTEIDFVKQGLNASIQFRNPNVTGECGCGESFTVN